MNSQTWRPAQGRAEQGHELLQQRTGIWRGDLVLRYTYLQRGNYLQHNVLNIIAAWLLSAPGNHPKYLCK